MVDLVQRHDESRLPTGVVTFLLTDIEGSTPLWDTHRAAMADAVDRHDVIADAVVREHGGFLLRHKGEGDSTMSVFARASDAMGAAIAFQEALRAEAWPPGIAIRVRMAIHTGEAHEREGDYFGPTVNRAARLRGLAAGGQVFVSEATAALIRDALAAGFSLAELGHHELRGMSRGELVYELLTDIARSAESAEAVPVASTQPPLPAPITVAASGLFAGREEIFDDVCRRWDGAEGCRALFLGGEPGVGKSRLAAQLAAYAHAAGATVLFGRCDEDAGAPFQPFAEALRTYTSACEPNDLRRRCGRFLREVARIVPTLRTRFPDLDLPTVAEPETERYILFEAVAALLSTVALESPVVLVMDDIHWADKPTLLMLRHVLRSSTGARVLVLGTFRDTELEETDLATFLADARRDEAVERVKLSGLDARGVASLVSAAAGQSLDDTGRELAEALHRETLGNCFFITSLLTHLVESGAIYQADGRWTSDRSVAELGLPDDVRDVVARRIGRLSRPAQELLAVAAVIGQRFSVDLVARALAGADTIDPLEESLTSGLITEVSQDQYAFVHGLIRNVIYERLSSVRRQRLHRDVAEALEARSSGVERSQLDALVHHVRNAGSEFPAARLAEVALAAGQEALDGLVYERAIYHLQAGIGALDGDATANRELRSQLFGILARATRYAGDREGSIAALQASAAEARAAGDATLLAAAACAVNGAYTYGQREPEILAVSEEALEAIGPEPTATRARLLALTSWLLFWAFSDRPRAKAMADEALEIARSIDDRGVLQLALNASSSVLRGTPLAAEQLSLLNELSAFRYQGPLAASMDERAITSAVLGMRERFDELLDEERQHFFASSELFVGVQEILDGRFAAAEEIALKAYLTAAADAPRLVAGSQLMWIMREQGRQAEVLPMVLEAAEQNPGIVAMRAAIAYLAVDAGEDELARREIAALIDNDFAVVPDDAGWPSALCMLADPVATLGDVGSAGPLLEKLAPFTGLLVAFPSFVGFAGAADRYIAMLLVTLGRPDEAEPYFESALDLEERMRSRPLAARTRYWFARMLLDRAAAGDDDRAKELLVSASVTADELGMRWLAERSRELLAAVR